MALPFSRTLARLGLIACVALAASVSFACAPRWLVVSISQRFPGCLYYVETAEPVLALTIDDGPNPVGTSAILEVLAEHDVRATFFMLGSRVMEHEALVRRVVEAGHELGNHLHEDRFSTRHSPREFDVRLHAVDFQLQEFQEVVDWFRPGSGFYDDEMLHELRRQGYRCALGSIYPYDAQVPFTSFARRYILRNARPGGVIVLHDGDRRGPRTSQVLARVLPELKERGFRFVTLSEIAALAP